jgi:hypothetical protein
MNEEAKLREARYFLDQMEAERDYPDRFGFNLSAFLSAARSAAQYALNDASGKRDGRRWYDSFLKKAPLIAFFTSERNANIHDRPVEPAGHVDVYDSDGVGLQDFVTVEFDSAGNFVEVPYLPAKAVLAESPPARVSCVRGAGSTEGVKQSHCHRS